jgi:hypothetical protein
VAQDLSGTKPWIDVDGPSLVRSAAALQLLPENIERLVRLQRLAAVGAALPGRPDVPRLSPSRLRGLLKDPLISGPEVRSHEDPYDDLCTAEIPFHGGPHLVMQGLTSRAAHTASLLLRTIFAPVGDSLPPEYRKDANLLASVLLRLSHATCTRAGLRRGIAPPTVRKAEIFVPGETRLNDLRQAVTFDIAALARLLPGAAVPVVRGLSVAVGEHRLELASGSDDRLVVTPLLATDEGVIANPGELATALRHHLILLADRYGCLPQLAQAFRHQVMQQITELLGLLGAKPVEGSDDSSDPLIARRRFTMADDKFIDLAVVTDDLSGYAADEPYGLWNVTDLSERVRDLIDSRGDTPEDGRTLRLIVNEGVGRTMVLGLQEPRRAGPMLMVMVDDLRIMIELDGNDPLFLWRFAQADDRLHTEIRVHSWSTLDNYAIYRENDYSYYLSDDRKPTFLSVAVASALPLRVEAQRRIDRHEVRSPHRESYIEVLAMYGSSTAPIYFTHPRYADHQLLVELENADIWFGASQEVSAGLFEFRNSVLEALAYWTWQIFTTQPGLLHVAAPSGRLYVDVAFDDIEAWTAVLSGTISETQAESWIQPDSPDGYRQRLRLSAGGGRLLLSGDNNADRLLLGALLTLFADLGGDNALDLSGLVEDLAPPGPKRMLRFTTSHEVLLRPGHLPRARMVQPAETANILDELGRWLASNGLPTGPIPASQRTNVLRDVVGHYFNRITDVVAGLSPDGLVNQLIGRHEALLRDEAVSRDNLPAKIACFGESSQLAQDLEREHKRRVEAAVASRFLVEYVAATPPTGQAPLTLETYDHLLALAAELASRATLSDAIYHGFSESQLSLLESGRLGVSRGDRYEAGTQSIAAANAESVRKLALEPRLGTPRGTPQPPSPEVEAAAQAEFGFTLTDLAHGVGELIGFGDERCAEEPYALTRPEVEQRLRDALGWSEPHTAAFIDQLTLRPRSKFLSVGVDAYPWRYNRDWSYVRRPIVQVEPATGDPILVWAARHIWATGPYWLDLVYSGRLRAHVQSMKSLMARIRQDQNQQFERQVAATMQTAGFGITASSVSKIAGRKLQSHDGHDLGDIDAIGVYLPKKVIIVAEAKDFELARNPAELANEAEDLLQGNKSALFKLARRTQWVRDHLSQTLTHLRINDKPAGWTVVPVIVTSRDLISPRVLPSDIPVVAIDALDSWIADELMRHRRGRGRRRQ